MKDKIKTNLDSDDTSTVGRKHRINTGLDWNKLAQVWNIARCFYLSSLRYAVNSTLDRRFLSVRYKCHIKCAAFECCLY